MYVRLAGWLRSTIPVGHETLQLSATLLASRTEGQVPEAGCGQQQRGVGVPLGERGGAAESGAVVQQGQSTLEHPQGARRRLVAAQPHTAQDVHGKGTPNSVFLNLCPTDHPFTLPSHQHKKTGFYKTSQNYVQKLTQWNQFYNKHSVKPLKSEL